MPAAYQIVTGIGTERRGLRQGADREDMKYDEDGVNYLDAPTRDATKP